MTKVLTVTEFARMGGNTILKKHGKEYFKRISKLGVEARMKKKQAQSENALDKEPAS